MPSCEVLEIEPFGEAVPQKGFDQSSCMHKFGHRIAGTDRVLAAVEIPLCIVQQSMPTEVMTRLTPRGTIRINLHWNEVDIQETPLIQLVGELLEPRALAMEEVHASDLEALRQSLETSIELVTAATVALSSLEELNHEGLEPGGNSIR